jgi:Icc-related predicted phosphoesterase
VRAQEAFGNLRKVKLLIFSDIHGDALALDRLMHQDADIYFAAGDLANFGRGLDKMGPLMQPRADRVWVIPGNHESATDVTLFCERFGFRDMHGRTEKLDGLTIAALGYSNPTPFNTPGEYSEEELAARLAPFAGIDPLVLICHCPPKETPLDRAGNGQHFGSSAVRDFIDKNQPLYFCCGHIHEAAGVSTELGRTKGFNVGKTGVTLHLTGLVK